MENYAAVGLDELLRALPLINLWPAGKSVWGKPSVEVLEEMGFMDEMEESGSGMDGSEVSGEGHAVLSNSLEFLLIGTVDPAAAMGLVSARFPALHELQLGGISCMSTVPDEDDEFEAALVQLLSWVTGAPVLTLHKTFTIRASNNRFVEHIVSALMPSPPCLLEGKRLVVCTRGCLTFALIDALSGLPGASPVSEVQIEARGADVQKVNAAVTRNAMVEAVQKFPLTRLVVQSEDID